MRAACSSERNNPPEARPLSHDGDGPASSIRPTGERFGRTGKTAFRDGSAPIAPAEYLTTREAAAYLRVSKSFLDKARVYGGGPEFVRLGPRKVVYRKRDLDDWARGRRYRSTSEYGEE